MIGEKAQTIIEARYLRGVDKSWADIAQRVGLAIGGKEKAEHYGAIINDMLFIPAGRILRNAGYSHGSLFNCYCLGIGDSREEIGELYKNAFILWGEGGGVGINFSTLRPKGATVKGVGGTSSGLVSFMRTADAVAKNVQSGGQRRAAALGLCEIWHPEIRDFIKAKQTDGALSHFNISVGITNEFLECVRDRADWQLSYNSREWSTINSSLLWDDIVSGMVDNGEPGLINMSNLRDNNSYYFAPIVATNPCGEVPLEENGVCNLGSLVLPKFVDNNGRVKWSLLEDTINHAVSFLDSCIDVNNYTLSEVQQTAIRGRRIGVGVMGLADMLFKLKLRYGSGEAIEFIEKLFKFIRNCCYAQSIKLSSERGSFPAFDSTPYCKAKFVRTLGYNMRHDIRKYGIRNVSCMAMAPTGTISLVANTTSGIEPLLYKAYTREDRVGSRTYVHPACDTGVGSDWFVDSTNLSPEHHMKTQIAIQKYTDGSVSKTILVPNDFKEESLSELLLESMEDVKGVTVYRDGSRQGQVIRQLDPSTIDMDSSDRQVGADEETVRCAKGTCEI